MLAGVQFIGILFGLIMVYFSYVSFKRKSYSWRSFLIWCIIWLGFILMLVFPKTVYGIMQVLEIERTADFFVMSGLLVYAAIIFSLYIEVKKSNRKVENIIRAIAFERQKRLEQEQAKAAAKKRPAKKKSVKRT